MKQRDIIAAYQVIEAFNKREKENHSASLKMNYALFKTRKLLEAHYQFQQESERKIYEEFSPEVLENNIIDFGTPERKDAFFARLAELGEIDVNLGEFVKPVININENTSLDPDEIAALEPFVEFAE